jgi:hypothetical protein
MVKVLFLRLVLTMIINEGETPTWWGTVIELNKKQVVITWVSLWIFVCDFFKKIYFGICFWLIRSVVHIGVMHSFVCAFIHDTAPCDVLCFPLLYSCFCSWHYLQWWHFALLLLCFSLWCFMWKIRTPLKEKKIHTFQYDIFTNE